MSAPFRVTSLPKSLSPFSRWRRLWPERMHQRLPRLAAWFDMLVIDLGLLRLPVNRPVEVVPGIWRSNQPSPWRLKHLAENGFKTVLNLRGEGQSGSYHLEHYYCEQLGLALNSVRLSSRRPPPVDRLEYVIKVLLEAPRPILLHCKSGADRAGLIAAMAVLMERQDVDSARAQLSLKYFHIKQASTGMMDHVIEKYIEAHSETGVSLEEWVSSRYDPDKVAASFSSRGPLTFLVDRVLRRE